jgi:hypothetical protein
MLVLTGGGALQREAMHHVLLSAKADEEEGLHSDDAEQQWDDLDAHLELEASLLFHSTPTYDGMQITTEVRRGVPC